MVPSTISSLPETFPPPRSGLDPDEFIININNKIEKKDEQLYFIYLRYIDYYTITSS